MLNGRSGSNDFTCFRHNGQSVVDYCLIPADYLCMYNDFAVYSPLFLKEQFSSISMDSLLDHAFLTWSVSLPTITPSTESLQTTDDQLKGDPGEFIGQSPPVSYRIDSVPNDFFPAQISCLRLMI